MKQLLLLCFLSITILTINAQNLECKVLPDSLQGTYAGECKNGKANGKGKATGTDTYDGEFKNGLPDGTGKYTWKNGNFYEGEWRKGMKDGKGELHTFEKDMPLVKTGFWKKDKYAGMYETPYRIASTTSDLGRVEVENADKKGKTVTLTVKSGLVDRESPFSPAISVPVTMTSFEITKGTYDTKTNTKAPQTDVTRFRDVEFPFMATFHFGNAILQIEIFEDGDWDIRVPIMR